MSPIPRAVPSLFLPTLALLVGKKRTPCHRCRGDARAWLPLERGAVLAGLWAPESLKGEFPTPGHLRSPASSVSLPAPVWLARPTVSLAPAVRGEDSEDRPSSTPGGCQSMPLHTSVGRCSSWSSFWALGSSHRPASTRCPRKLVRGPVLARTRLPS